MTDEGAREQAVGHLRRLAAEGVWALRTPASIATGAPSVPAPGADREDVATVAMTLDEVAAASSGCELCKLSEHRTNVVFGVGDPAARIMFIGEGPGRDEDLQGEQFVGAAGQLLNKILAAMGLAREDVYIANTVKCRPPNNRNPEPDELMACRPYLLQQVELIKPEVIVVLGRVAMQAVLNTDAALGRMRGRLHDWNGIPIVCTYHPAYLLRTPEDKGKTWDDMQLVMQHLGLAQR